MIDRDKPLPPCTNVAGESAVPSVAIERQGTIERQGAAAICRGTRRLLAHLGFVTLPEMPLPNGRRADLLGLGRDGQLWVVEVKSSVADFRADQKWRDYLPFADRFSFAVDAAFPQGLIPPESGLIVADGFGASELRPATVLERLAPARRRSLHMGFARLAAARLHGLHDPAAAGPDGLI